MGSQHAHRPEHNDHSHDHCAHGQAGSAFCWSSVLNSGLTALQLVIQPAQPPARPRLLHLRLWP